MKLSMMSYTMARQQGFSLKKMFELTAELKFAGVDMVTCYDTPASDLRKMADDYAVPIVAHTFFANDLASTDPQIQQRGIDTAKKSIDDAVTLGAPLVMIPTPGQDDIDRDTLRQRFTDGLAHVVPLAKQANIILTVENFPGDNSPVVTAADFLDIHNQLPDIKLTFDNGNAGSAEDPADSFTACAQHTVHAHFKDWLISDTPQEGYRPMLDGRYYKSALIGQGQIDHPKTLRAMKAANYTGCINIEYESNEIPADRAIRQAADYLNALIASL